MNMPNQVVGFVLAHYGINNVTRVVNFSHFVAPLIYHIAVFFLYGSSHQSIILFFLSQFCLHPQAWDRLFYASQIPIHGTLYFIFSLERIFSSCNNQYLQNSPTPQSNWKKTLGQQQATKIQILSNKRIYRSHFITVHANNPR